MLLKQTDWNPYPRTPAEWKSAVPAGVLEALVKEGVESLTYKFEPITATTALDFVRTGDRTRHSRISFGKRDALMRLIVAESIEDKGRFMEAILNGIWSICEESYWGVPAHIGRTGLPDVTNPVVDLFSAETATGLALADYFVGQKLDKINRLVRARIYHETNHRIFVPMLTRSADYGWMSKTKPVNNWNPWICSNWIASTLFLEQDPVRRGEMIHGAMLALDRYLNSLGDAGGCDEGPGYWNAAGASTYDCLELLSKATRGGVTLFREPLVRNMASYIYKAHIADSYYINFADAAPRTHPDGYMVYRFGEAIGDPLMTQFGLWLVQRKESELSVEGHQKFRKLENLLSLKKMPAARSTYTPVPDAWIPDVQVLTARSQKGLFLGTHGGHNAESHNHNDVGDFVIYADGQPMIVDVGSGTYTSRTFSSKRYELWYTNSLHHNLPIINGTGQKDGRQYEARDVACAIDPDLARLTMDIAPAYPKQAGLKTWRRQVSLDRRAETIEVLDSYVCAKAPTSLQQVFMTVAAVDVSVPGRIVLKGSGGVAMALVYDANLMKASVEQPLQTGPDYGSLPRKWDDRKIYRVLLTHVKPAAEGTLRYRFERR